MVKDRDFLRDFGMRHALDDSWRHTTHWVIRNSVGMIKEEFISRRHSFYDSNSHAVNFPKFRTNRKRVARATSKNQNQNIYPCCHCRGPRAKTKHGAVCTKCEKTICPRHRNSECDEAIVEYVTSNEVIESRFVI